MEKALIGMLMMAMTASGCANNMAVHDTRPAAEISISEDGNTTEKADETKQENELSLSVNGTTLTVTWEDNESVSALAELAAQEAVTVNTHKYGGFEQVGSLPQSITDNDAQMTAVPGDIVLYSGNSIVLFYGSNTWSYTKLGHIEGLSEDELNTLLDVEQTDVTLSISHTENGAV